MPLYFILLVILLYTCTQKTAASSVLMMGSHFSLTKLFDRPRLDMYKTS
jgi:hypothetical protein